MLTKAPEDVGTDNGVHDAVDRQAEAVRTGIDFRVVLAYERGGVRVCPIGEIDIATVDELRERVDEVLASGAHRLVLDLRRTTFIDSTGLRAAMHAHQSAASSRTEFALVAGPPAVQRPFEITGLDKLLPFVEPDRLED
jgi:anti-sigma B factor antagonist